MRGVKAQAANLSDAEQQGLEKLIKRHQVGRQIAKRARIVLAAAGGQKNKEIAQVYKVTLDTVSLWRNRWVKLQDISLDDLSIADRLHAKRAPARITADQHGMVLCLFPATLMLRAENWLPVQLTRQAMKKILGSISRTAQIQTR